MPLSCRKLDLAILSILEYYSIFTKMTTHSFNYQMLITEQIYHKFEAVLQKAEAGHCMKLSGVSDGILHNLWAHINTNIPQIDCFILSGSDLEEEKYISATKLIEYRNLEEKPLLVLIPSTLRTAAEDSFGSATFKELMIEDIESKAYDFLFSKFAEEVQNNLKEIIDYLYRDTPDVSKLISYFLHLLNNGANNENIGNYLYFLNLLPDAILLNDFQQVKARLNFNQRSIEILTNFKVPLSDRIKELPVIVPTVLLDNQNDLPKNLYHFFTNNPKLRTGYLIGKTIFESHPNLNFSNWSLKIGNIEELKVELTEIRSTNKHLVRDENGSLLLKPPSAGKSAKFTVKFTTHPLPPDTAPKLSQFRIDLMRVLGGGEYESVISLKKFANSKAKRKFRTKDLELNSSMIPDDFYFVRVIALDEDGVQLNNNDDFSDSNIQREWLEEYKKNKAQADRAAFKGKLKSDSENFYFQGEENELEDEIEEVESRKDKVSNVLQAFFHLRISYLKNKENCPVLEPDTKNAWKWLGGKKKALEKVFHARFKDQKFNFQVIVSHKLFELEKTILQAPLKLGYCVAEIYRQGTIEEGSITHSTSILNHLVEEEFKENRKLLFNAILESVNTKDGIFETFEIYKHREVIEKYLQSYINYTSKIIDTIREKSVKNKEEQIELRNLLYALQNLDLIKLKTRLQNQEPVTAFLLPPIHPLRLAWSLTLSKLYEEWEEKTMNYQSAYLSSWTEEIQSLFLGQLYPTNNPLVLADYDSPDRRSFEYVGELSFGWGLYLKSQSIELDTKTMNSHNRLIMNFLQKLLNIPNNQFTENDVDGKLAVKYLRNYLKQHPYIEQLNINLFNAGEAITFADSLLDLEKDPKFKNLRYEVRLFTNHDRIVENGGAFKRLLNPETTMSEEAEAFSQSTSNRLFPKLRFSIATIEDYINNAKSYDSHIGFIINPFPLRTSLYKAVDKYQSIFLDGLIVEPEIEVEVTNDHNSFIWTRFIASSDNSDSLIEKSFNNLQRIISSNISQKVVDMLPVTQLILKDADKVLLDIIHSHTDWVITFDKHFGAEFYDLPKRDTEVPFLLDYIPSEGINRTSTFLTTKPTSEITGLIEPHLSKWMTDIDDSNKITQELLEDIRTISGSLILQINSTENKALELIGLALTKRLFELQHVLKNQFIIPIDLHQNLFIQNKKKDTVLQKRADLLLLSISPEERIITIQIIEVKCRSSLTESQTKQLCREMEEQMSNTEKTLNRHFGTNQIPERLDIAIKNKEIDNLLSFYIRRAYRYNLMNKKTKEEYLIFLETLQKGYNLNYKKTGIIFDFTSKSKLTKGYASEEFNFFKIGAKLIQPLLKKDTDTTTLRKLIPHDFTLRITHKASESEFINEIKRQIENEQSLSKKGDSSKDSYKIKEIEKSKVEEPPSVEAVQIPSINTKKETQVTFVSKEESNLSKEDIVKKIETPHVPPAYDIFIGDNNPTSQYGIIGSTINGKKLGLDLSGTNTISLFGVQGAGKSYSIGTVTEMVLKSFNKVNQLNEPLAGVIFHYSDSEDYKPEFTSMIYPNSKKRELKLLKEIYDAEPDSLDEVMLLVPKAKVEIRQQEYPSIQVLPIAFSSSELGISDWKFLMGATGNQSLYIKQINNLMRPIRNEITLEKLESTINDTHLLSQSQRELANSRLYLAREYIDDDVSLKELIKPGKLIIVDLRDEFIEQDEALGLFVIMLNIFANAKKQDDSTFNKFIVFDEAHKYMNDKNLTGNIVKTIREMRHKGVTLMIASQDPPSLPNEIIELSSLMVLHRFNSPQWLKHVQKSITQLASLTPKDMANLQQGEAFLWTNKSNHRQFTQMALKVKMRPRLTQHGGETQRVG